MRVIYFPYRFTSSFLLCSKNYLKDIRCSIHIHINYFLMVPKEITRESGVPKVCSGVKYNIHSFRSFVYLFLKVLRRNTYIRWELPNFQSYSFISEYRYLVTRAEGSEMKKHDRKREINAFSKAEKVIIWEMKKERKKRREKCAREECTLSRTSHKMSFTLLSSVTSLEKRGDFLASRTTTNAVFAFNYCHLTKRKTYIISVWIWHTSTSIKDHSHQIRPQKPTSSCDQAADTFQLIPFEFSAWLELCHEL